MKCRACDDILTDGEAVRKDKNGQFVDLCSPCFNAGEPEELIIFNDEIIPDEFEIEQDIIEE